MEQNLNADHLADFTTDARVLLLSSMAVVIGTMAACAASALLWLIALINNLAFFQTLTSHPASPAGHHLGLWVVLVPVLGGLIIGVMARFGSEKIRGHGIPEALEAILIGRSKMEAKVALLKPLSSAISIGTGGPFGAEGPIIMTGGAMGSLFAQLFHLSSAERKTLLVAGAAAGMSAVFATPVSAVLLAVELLLFEWKPRSFIPVGIASIVAFGLRIPLLGDGPIFPVMAHPSLHFPLLIIAFAIGIVAGCGSGLLTGLVYGFEDLFKKIPIHWMWWPALGGLFVGIGGWLEPRSLGVGYDIIHQLLRGELVGPMLLGLLVGKALIWSIALGSGTSGGVLAPLLMMGAILGAVESHWISMGDAGMWATISMAAMMGGTMRSPLTATIFALELTQDLNLLPALLAGCIASHLLTVLLLRRSILTEKLARRGYHIVREYSIDPLHRIRVGDVMNTEIAKISEKLTVREVSERISKGDPELIRHNALLIVDGRQELRGIITRGDIMASLEEDREGKRTVLDAGADTLYSSTPNTLLHDAVNLMLVNDIGRLPVVDPSNHKKIVGYLGRAEVLQARLHQINEENDREKGWLGKNSPPVRIEV